MNTVAKILNGLGSLYFEDVEYVVCPIYEKDDITPHYLNNGSVTNPEEGIERFRLVAVKSGTPPITQEYYPVCQLICHVEKGNVYVEKSMELEYNDMLVFFDDKNKRIGYVPKNRLIDEMDHYGTPYLLKYSVTNDLEKSPWI